jgi:glutaminase
MTDDIDAILGEIAAEVRPNLGTGRVANYIPALAKADPMKFGMAVTTLGGDVFTVGDADERFSIQSISKVFGLTMALGEVGGELWDRVGREPSGTAFNSLVQLEHEHGIPRNPLINAGAIVVTDVNVSHCQSGQPIDKIVDFLRARSGSTEVGVDKEVARSEAETGFRNVAMANFMKSFGNLTNDVDTVLDTYFQQCAITMSCRELSRAVLYLAGRGTDPILRQQIVAPQRAKRINSLMLTCGHYDASGDFAFRVGLPGKSGVAGGIVAVVPRRMGIAVWSPGLNAQGNSFVGTMALEKFAEKTGYSVF